MSSPWYDELMNVAYEQHSHRCGCEDCEVQVDRFILNLLVSCIDQHPALQQQILSSARKEVQP